MKALLGHTSSRRLSTMYLGDGPSHFGSVHSKTGDPVSLHIENVCGWFDQSANEFLLRHTCASETEFEDHLGTLIKHCRHVRGLSEDHPNQASRSDPQSTTADPLPPQPMPESTGETG